MISCEGCKVWQYFKCMGLPWDSEPLHYLCERCQPADQQKLLRETRGGETSSERDDEGVRCVCGCTSADTTGGHIMIMCDGCEFWQHLECMGIPGDPFRDRRKRYFCEQCRPADHKKLLGEIKRGEKPWEDRRRVREQAVERERAEKEMKPWKGKRKTGIKGKPSTTVYSSTSH